MWIHVRHKTAPVAPRVCVFTGKTCLSHNLCRCLKFLCEIWSFKPQSTCGENIAPDKWPLLASDFKVLGLGPSCCQSPGRP